MSPGALPWFSSWYVVSIETGHRAQSPHSGPRWSPAFQTEPVLFPPSIPRHHGPRPGRQTAALPISEVRWSGAGRPW